MSPRRSSKKKNLRARLLAMKWARPARPAKRRRTGGKPSLMNVDFKARAQRVPWQRLATPLIVLGLAAGLLLTGLRTDIVRMEYALASAAAEEQTLLGQQRRLTVEHRDLLDPKRLGRIAKQRGFVRPQRVIELDAEPQFAASQEATRP